MKKVKYLVVLAFLTAGCEQVAFNNNMDPRSPDFLDYDEVLADPDNDGISNYYEDDDKDGTLNFEDPDSRWFDAPPQIRLEGDSVMVIDVGERFSDPGVTAFDKFDGDVSENVKVSGKINSSVFGVCTLTYSAADRSGNESEKLRIVYVGSRVSRFIAGMALNTSGEVKAFSLTNQGDSFTCFLSDPYSPQVFADVKDMQAAPYGSHRIILQNDGELYSLTLNDYNREVITKIGDNAVSFSAAFFNDDLKRIFAVRQNGALWAKGDNGGKFGNNNTTSSEEFIQVSENVFKVAAGPDFTCIIKKDNSFWVTGANTYGQHGDSTTDTRYEFTQTADSVIDVTCGDAQTFIIKSDNSLWFAGYTYYFRITAEDVDRHLKFTKVADDVKRVFNTVDSLYFIKTDNSLWKHDNGISTIITDDVKDLRFGTYHVNTWSSRIVPVILKNDLSLWVFDSGKLLKVKYSNE